MYVIFRAVGENTCEI